MKAVQPVKAFLFFLLVNCLFFYSVFLKHSVPFPGDLLLSHYKPWQTYSYLGYLPGSYPTKWQYFDTLRQIYPWRDLSFSMLKTGQIPLWNPFNFAGMPLLANFQSAVFYPLNLFFALLPTITAWTLTVFLQPLLAAFFTYLFCRSIGIKTLGSILAGLTYAYCGFMTVFLEYNTINQTILWLPLILYLFEKINEKPSFLNQFVFSLVIAFSLLAGHPQSAILVMVFSVIYFIFRLLQTQSLKIRGIRLLILVIISLGLATIQFLPTLELSRYAARVPHDYDYLVEKLLIQPKQLLMLAVPDFFGNPATGSYRLGDTYPGKVTYVGLVPLIFAVWSLIKVRKNHHLWFWSIGSLVILSLLVSWPVSKLLYQVRLPIVSSASPGNAIFLFSFCLSILAGWGIEGWLVDKARKKYLLPAILGLIFIILLVGLVLYRHFHPDFAIFFKSSFKNLVYSTLVLLFFVAGSIFARRTKFRTLAVVFLIVLTIADLFYFHRKFNSFVPSQTVYPDAPVFNWLKTNAGENRFWGYGSAVTEANFNVVSKIYSPEGYDPLYPKQYGEFLYSAKDGKLLSDFNRSTRSDAIVTQSFGAVNFVNNPYRAKVLSMLGVKYILDRTENGSDERTFPPDDYRLVWESDGWRIFENLRVLPRFFLADNYEIIKDKSDFEKLFFLPTADSGQTLLLEEEPLITPSPAKKKKVEVEQYSAESIVLKTKADADQLLFISDTFFPGWQASIDGYSTKVLRGNWAFRVVGVPKGEHVVAMQYRPTAFSWGARITIVSLLFLFLFTKLWPAKSQLS